MSETPNLKLPYLQAAQAQKHLTHNEALQALDALVQMTVLDRNLSTPPASPIDGVRYIVGASASGAWSGHDGAIAAWQDNAWAFFTPQPGWRAYIVDEDGLAVWDGSQWRNLSASVNPAPLVGVNTTADAVNKLAAKSDVILFSHDDVTPGSGEIRTILNKSSAARTASFLFQTGYSGRAEIGLAGSDDLHLKVSADGTNWLTALTVNRSTAVVTLPNTSLAGGTGANGNILINGDFSINQRVFAGGSLANGIYGHDRWKALGGTAVYSVAGDHTVTLTSGTLAQIVEAPSLAGLAVTLSVEGLSGGSLAVDIEGQTGSIAAASGRSGVTLAVPSGSTGNITVKLTPTAGAVSFRNVKLEYGSVATQWQPRPIAQELLLCQRYFWKTYDVYTAPGTAVYANSFAGRDVVDSTVSKEFLTARFPVAMRTTPTVIWYNPVTGTINEIRRYSGGTNHAVALTDSPGSRSTGFPKLSTAAGSAGNLWYAHCTADAEL